MTRIAVVTPDVLGARMAGPAIRARAIAMELAAAGHDVVLISTQPGARAVPGVRVESAIGWKALRASVGAADVVVVQGYVTYHAPWLLDDGHVLVVDLYDPVHLEQFEQLGDREAGERQAMLDLTVRVLNEQLLRGDFFLCASDDQRRLWLGHLAALGRVNDATYADDHALRSLIDVAPFGLPVAPPERTGPGLRAAAGLAAEDRVVLWAGGVYNWFDPLTVIRAVHELRTAHADVRLFFLGMAHPNPDVPAMRVATEARKLSDELGLTGRFVFFNEGWVPYDERQNYLLDADVGVSTHFDHLETAFSFRTRILDYLWAGLPVVTTDGDAFGALVRTEGLGAAVPERDVAALTKALETYLYDVDAAATARHNVAQVRERFGWPQALAPLVAFCSAPHRAADAGLDQHRIARRPVMPRQPALRLATRVTLLVRQGGPQLLVRRLRERRARNRSSTAE